MEESKWNPIDLADCKAGKDVCYLERQQAITAELFEVCYHQYVGDTQLYIFMKTVLWEAQCQVRSRLKLRR